MYTLGTINITLAQLNKRLEQEQRQTKPCPFCKRKSILPVSVGCEFFMECTNCRACGPVITDYSDPAGLNETSWVYALKVCHDRWNSCSEVI